MGSVQLFPCRSGDARCTDRFGEYGTCVNYRARHTVLYRAFLAGIRRSTYIVASYRSKTEEWAAGSR